MPGAAVEDRVTQSSAVPIEIPALSVRPVRRTDLGAITLSGIDPVADHPSVFGVAFETGGTPGTVKANLGAGLVTLVAPLTNEAFTFRAI